MTADTTQLARVGFVAAALFILTDGPLFFGAYEVLGRSGEPTWNDTVVAVGLVATTAAATALVLWRLWRSRMRQPLRPQPLGAAAVVAFVAITACSAIWSLEPLDTAGRAVIYAGLAVLAWQLADMHEQANTALTLMAAAAVTASLIAIALGAGAAFDPNDDWQGIYLSRNLLAPVAAIGVIAGIRMICDTRASRRLTGAALVVASVITMAGAGSRTAWLALAGGIGITAVPLLHRWLKQRSEPRRAATLAAAALVGAVLVTVGAVAVLWDTSTLAQRRTIWRVSWEQIGERVLFGHGFAAVWSSPEFLDNHELLDRGSAHNAALEVLLGLGVLGLVPFAVIVVLAVRNPLRDLMQRPNADTWMWAAIVAVMLIENITESFILRFSYNWVIIMAAALRPTLRRLRHDARAPHSGFEEVHPPPPNRQERRPEAPARHAGTAQDPG